MAKTITTTPQGFLKAAYLTDDHFEQILDQITEGVHPHEACRAVGTSATQFKHCRERNPELQAQFDAAMEVYNNGARLNKLHAERDYHIFEAHNWQALREQLLIHDPEYEVLRTQRFQVGVTAETLGEAAKDAFAGQSDEDLRARLALIEAAKKGDNVIELPQVTGEQPGS